MSAPGPPEPLWHTRPVVVVSGVARSVAFYVDALGFKRDWGSEQDGKPDVVQVSRGGCELILCAHWPERVGHSLVFIELRPEILSTVRAEFEGRGVAVEDGWWGYDLLVVRDPDGNTLYFPHETSARTPG